MAAYAGAGLTILGGVVIVVVALIGRNRERILLTRVDRLVRMRTTEAAGVTATPAARRLASLDRRIRAAFAFRMRRSWGASTGTPALLVIGIAAAVLNWTVIRHALHMPLYIGALAGAVGFLTVPRLVLIRAQHRADLRFAELLPDAIDMVVRMVRAGLPVGVAIRSVGREANAPINSVFVKIADLAEIGIPLPEALSRVAETVGSADFRFFGVAVALQQATGGNLAVTLETLSEIIRKRRAVRMKGKAATAEIRISALVLAAIPFLVVGALLLISPGYLEPLITDPRGNVIVASALLSLALAGITMRSMIRASMMG